MEEEPDEDCSDEEYEAWDEYNPPWQLEKDLDVYLDSDFIETIYEDTDLAYLKTQIVRPDDFEVLKGLIPADHNTLVLIMSEALGGFESTLSATPQLAYHGDFLWNC